MQFVNGGCVPYASDVCCANLSTNCLCYLNRYFLENAFFRKLHGRRTPHWTSLALCGLSVRNCMCQYDEYNATLVAKRVAEFRGQVEDACSCMLGSQTHLISGCNDSSRLARAQRLEASRSCAAWRRLPDGAICRTLQSGSTLNVSRWRSTKVFRI